MHYPLCVIEPWSLIPLYNSRTGLDNFTTRQLRLLEKEILFLPLVDHRLLSPTPHALIEEIQFASSVMRELRQHSTGMHEYLPTELDMVLQKMTQGLSFLFCLSLPV